MTPPRGQLLVISGPSGAGKSSICDELVRRIHGAMLSVSVTTRPKRAGEVDGQDYYFIDRAEYDRLIADGDLLEHAEYLGNGYGTPRKPVAAAIAAGKTVILEIEVQGGAQVARRMPESVRVFVLPPTMETLRARLEGRNTEAEAIQEKRLAKADGEIAFAKNSGVYPYFVTNDTIPDSAERIIAILKATAEK